MGLAVVKDLRVARAPATTQDLEALETDVLAGFVLARAVAGLSDQTISSVRPDGRERVYCSAARISWRPAERVDPALQAVAFARS